MGVTHRPLTRKQTRPPVPIVGAPIRLPGRRARIAVGDTAAEFAPPFRHNDAPLRGEAGGKRHGIAPPARRGRSAEARNSTQASSGPA